MEFIDLKAQQQQIRTEIDAAINKVLTHGAYIMGPEVFELEEKLASFCGAKYAISCASGTDALILTLMALGITQGDSVLVPSFTFAATVEAVVLLKAKPVFVDIDPITFNMAPTALETAIKEAKNCKEQPKAIIAVDMFGAPANYKDLQIIAKNHGLFLIADAAQSFGATYHQQFVGTLADCTTTSFFPAKPLGCYGDGGAVFTNDENLQELIKALRIHGQGKTRYQHLYAGINSRLDTIQAAILLEKLKIFPIELNLRQIAAERYQALMGNLITTPIIQPNSVSSWAQYTLKSRKREQIINHLKEVGIPTGIYYPTPLHLQKAFVHYGAMDINLPNTINVSKEVFSLPMHPYLTLAQQQLIAKEIKIALAAETINIT